MFGCAAVIKVPVRLDATILATVIVFANLKANGVLPLLIVAEFPVAVLIPTNRLLSVCMVIFGMLAANIMLPEVLSCLSPGPAVTLVTPVANVTP